MNPIFVSGRLLLGWVFRVQNWVKFGLGWVGPQGKKFWVRDMFALGQKESPCVLFIDKIDAIGLKRGHRAQGEGKF